MDNQRLFPVIALVFILFLIWENWMEFQARKHPPPPAASPPPAAALTGQPAPPPTGEFGGVRDVPAAVGGGAQPSSALKSGQRIRVRTDVFEAELDTVGGDLRQVGLLTYPVSIKERDKPFSLLYDTSSQLFILQSGLVSSSGQPAPDHYAVFSAEQSEYRLPEGQDTLTVPLTWSDPSGLKVVKTYTFHRGRFDIGLNQRVENATGQEWRGNQYRQLQRTPPLEQPSMFGGVYTYTGGVISTPDKPYEKISFDDMTSQPLDRHVMGGWVAMIQHYFLAALVPNREQSETFYSKAVDGKRFILGMLGPAQTAPAGGTVELSTQVYVGPKVQDDLAALAPHLELTVDYGYFTIIAQPLFWILKLLYNLTGNWGWAIIIITILIKGAFFKLSETSYRSMAKMKVLAPKLNSLKERYGDDRQRLNQAMMDMYKQEKVNPLGGCLPILVQIPVFIALYWMLLESVELRQAPFMLWIQDLSVKDPYYVLPLIMGATMVVQQKLNPPPPDPVQAKVMMMLPFIFTFLFLFFPSGLVLYWVVNNVLSIAQQYVITKRIEQEAGKP